METWSVFSGSDIGLALIGLAGLVSVIVVMTAATGNVGKREISRRKAIDAFMSSLPSNKE
jgi:hypothetical protein